MKTIYFFLLILLSVQLSYAQDSVVVFKSEVSEIMAIPLNNEDITVSSATKIEQSIAQAPNLISSIGRKQIAEYGFISLNDIVYRQAGMSYSQDFDRPTISLRGNYENWNNNHWLMLVDGIPYNENTYASTLTSENTPLIFTKSVEVIRGAGSALYGTNAMNGVISMNTVSVADLKGNSEFRIRVGNDGLRIYDGIVGAENKKVAIIIAFNHYQNNGTSYMTYDGSGRTNPDGSLKKFQTNNAKNSNYLFAKLEFKGKLRGLSMQYHEQHWDFGTGVGWAFNTPDQAEFLDEYKRVLSLSYKTDASKKLSAEFVLRYQNRGWDWNMRFAHDSSVYFGNVYPNGISEFVQTEVNDVFSRAQMTYRFDNSGVFLAGVENTAYYYGGDKGHYSNIDLNNTYGPNANNASLPANGYFSRIQDIWVVNTGVYGQYVSPKLINEKLSITAGLRYDIQPSDYRDISAPDKPLLKKSFEKLSPRLSLVYAATKNFYVKAMAGRAFRVPSYAELFSANTFAVASNASQLVAEIADTYELAGDWQLNKSWNFRGNVFYNVFQNLIAYSTQNNALATNMYTITTAGAESEIIWTGKQHNKHQWSGFFNYGYAKRIAETILDSTVSISNQITWVSSQTAKLGVVYKHAKFYVSSVVTYQGETLRRSSDNTPTLTYSGTVVDSKEYRPSAVPAWTNVDLKFAYTFNKHFELGFMVNNLFNSERFLLKSFGYPMDYQMQRRLVMLDLKFNY